MEDWIARIYPAADNASLTANAIQGSQHHVLPSTHNIRQLLPYDSREPTPLPDEDDESQQGAEEPYVELRFSRPPSSPHGFLFGRNPQSEVVLPGIVGVSHFHFSITFDDERRLIIKDLQSSVGTQVTYDGMGAGVRRGFSWIIGGDSHILNAEINVMVRKGLQFRIVVASHDMRSKQYMACVDRYRRGQALPQHLFETLELKVRPDTERPTGVHTPKVGEVYLTKVIGHGAFAVVTQFWNVSTGGLHVVKTPLPKLVAQRKVDMDAWNNEIHIMKLISRKRHPHIVEFLGAKPDPYPEISLEYIAGGSLDKYWDISTTESWTILQQCLLALEYLHGHDPPIVHRDIKPANILVCDRRRGLIHVKLADFGLARDYDNLSTICGTRNYLAPEIYANDQYARNGGRDRQSYNASADIWSLGVVVLELECRLPQWQAKYGSLGTFWCEHILGTVNEHLRENPSELGEFLLRKMVILSPNLRASAKHCLGEGNFAAQAGSSAQTHSATSVQSEQPTYYRRDDTLVGRGRQAIVLAKGSPVETAPQSNALSNRLHSLRHGNGLTTVVRSQPTETAHGIGRRDGVAHDQEVSADEEFSEEDSEESYQEDCDEGDQETNEEENHEVEEKRENSLENDEDDEFAPSSWQFTSLVEGDNSRSGLCDYSDSVFTEADYENGSYLAQASRSHLVRFNPNLSISPTSTSYNVESEPSNDFFPYT